MRLSMLRNGSFAIVALTGMTVNGMFAASGSFEAVSPSQAAEVMGRVFRRFGCALASLWGCVRRLWVRQRSWNSPGSRDRCKCYVHAVCMRCDGRSYPLVRLQLLHRRLTTDRPVFRGGDSQDVERPQSLYSAIPVAIQVG